jgi:chaperonin GroES
VPGTNVVRGKVVGRDADGTKRDRATRIGEHMSYQLLEEMEDWEEDTDKLLHVLPIMGTVFRKTWFDPTMGRNRSEMVTPDKLIVNYWAKSFETVPRYTHEIDLYPYEIEERIRGGIFRDVELGTPIGDEKHPSSDDEDAPHCFLEQYRRIDLDDDGYPEPYIVTIHKDSHNVVRIVANYDEDSVEIDENSGEIKRISTVGYCTKYGFIPSPDGSFYDVGFGSLLNPLNESVNTVINQLLDAGTLANAGGGFIGTGLRMGSGPITRKPGRWQPVDATGAMLRDNIVPHMDKEPSGVLFSLLGLLIDAGKDISSTKDIMLGDQGGANMTATTTLALVEQGQKVFSAIYKRIHRSLKSEMKKLYNLNRIYLPPEAYFNVLDEPKAIAQNDYAAGDVDVIPISDPSMVSDMQKMARAEFLMQFIGDPEMNAGEIKRRMLEAAGIDRIDELMASEPPPPSPDAIKAEMEAKRNEAEIIRIAAEVRHIEAKIGETVAKAIKAIADAEKAEAGPQLEMYKSQLQSLLALATNQTEVDDGENDEGGMGGMAQKPGNAEIPPLPG